MTCRNEDLNGRICFLGDGHAGRCEFGGLRLTAGQEAILRRLLSGPVESFGGGGPAASSLERKALVRRQFIGMRWWRLCLTPAGVSAAQGLPR